MNRNRSQVREVVNRNMVVSLALEQDFNAFLPVYDDGVDFILYRESDNELMITAEVPGVDEKDVEVTLTDNVLTIKGEKKAQHEQKNGDASYMERRYGAFSRSLRLPFAIKDEEVDAKYDKGVLTITIPKPADAQTHVRRIEVKGA